MALRSRRPNPPKLRPYQRYKPLLREDFTYLCVYCELHENESGGPRFFSVEHFRPKSRFPNLTTEYSNLLYACGVCNSYKGNDWPAEDPIATGKGYLDPCEHDYSDHFATDADFRLLEKTAIGRYMIDRLHLNRPMLQKLRRSRHEQEQAHQQFIALFERNLALIAAALADQDLSKSKRRGLEADLAAARSQYERYLAGWQQRWDPLYNTEDY